ncbi:MAG: hypothetical protein Ta2A_04490 [Treponemataceae bacterium]|nr:MAG: hypothetical protein Ta2A_04490 [Treponemataceae bacterium]
MQPKKSKTALLLCSGVSLLAIFFAALLAVVFVSCRPFDKQEYIIPYQNLVTRNASTKIVAKETDLTLENLNNANIYIVRVNRSKSAVNVAKTGRVIVIPLDRVIRNNRLSSVQGNFAPSSISSESSSDSSISVEAGSAENPPEAGRVLLKDSPRVAAFNANPPPYPKDTTRSSGILRSIVAPSLAVVNSTRRFWVENGYVDATVRATGTTCNVWIADSYNGSTISGLNSFDDSSGTNYRDEKLTTVQAQAIANKFDSIYGYATNLLGYEYGGPVSGGNGGVDGDPKIQILIYKHSEYDVVGYFYSADAYPQSYLDKYAPGHKSNQAEIFYLNSWFLDEASPELAYSTLVHEFQHMVNFNRKYIQKNLDSSTWYDEMLSLLAEDVMDAYLGILPEWRPDSVRMTEFLVEYAQDGITQWRSSTDYYARAYAFGAYLLRNFGGADLLREMLANNSVDETSVTQALQKKYPSMNFQTALSRYGEALLFSGGQKPKDVFSFDNTVTSTIGGKTYTASRFDIWEKGGPHIYPLTLQRNLPPTSILIQNSPELLNASGTREFTIKLPENRNVDIYVIVRNNLP